MIDERLRALGRTVADATALTLERLDRDLARAGFPTIRSDMVVRLAAALRERAIDEALAWAEWRLPPMPRWTATEVTCSPPPLPVRDLVREVERNVAELARRNREGKTTALHITIGEGPNSFFLVRPWAEVVAWPNWGWVPSSHAPDEPPFYVRTRASLTGLSLDGGLVLHAPAFLGPFNARLETATRDTNLHGGGFRALERVS